MGASRQYGEYSERGYSPEDFKVRKQPSFFVTTSFWFKGHYLRATRTRTQGTAHVGLQTLKIRQVFSVEHRLTRITDLVAGFMVTTQGSSMTFSRTPNVAGRRPSWNKLQFTHQRQQTSGVRSLFVLDGRWVLSSSIVVSRRTFCPMPVHSSGADLGTPSVVSLSEGVIFS